MCDNLVISIQVNASRLAMADTVRYKRRNNQQQQQQFKKSWT